MTLDLKRIFANEGSSLEIDYEIDMSYLDVSGDSPLKKPVKIKGSVFNRADVVTLQLSISYEFAAPCYRCGTFAENEHAVFIDKMLANSLERQESDTIIKIDGMKLDVDELVYSEVVLDLPTKHLCKEDCKGLCCNCGKNLNEGECGCDTDYIDPRLAKLKELLEN